MEKDIHDKIDATLNSFDNMQRAEMPPFFQTRLIARLKKERQLENVWLPVRKPVLLIALLTVMLLINTVLLTQKINTKKTNSFSESSSLQGFASEYQLNTTSTNY